jgi:hypothetical protein
MKNDPEYLIWHQGHKYVLARTHSTAVAQALIEGILNTEIVVSFPDWGAGTPEDLSAEYLIFDVFKQKIVAGNEPDPSIQRMIRLAHARAEYLLKLELMINRYHMRFFGSFDTEFYAWIGTALARSSPDNLDPMLAEYATIQEIDHASAYYDLKMRWDSYAMVKMKAFSYFEKFKQLINNCNSSDEMSSVVQKCRYDLYIAATI